MKGRGLVPDTYNLKLLHSAVAQVEAVSTDPASKLNVLGLDCDAPCVDRAEQRVIKEVLRSLNVPEGAWWHAIARATPSRILTTM